MLKWVKLWREESGSFAQLPLVARALFAETLKLADESGVIHLGGREPADAIAFALGADRSDRRALRKHIPLLLKDGCLVHEGDTLRFPGWGRFQDAGPRSRPSRKAPTEPPAKAPRAEPDGAPTSNVTRLPTRHDGAATVPRPCHDGATTEPRRSHESGAKCPESHSRALRRRIEEEEDQEHTPQTPHRGAVRVSSLSGLPDPLGELDGVSSEEFVTRAFDAVGREIGMAPPPRRPQDRARAQELERWALELAPRVAESRGMEVEAAFCKLLEVAFDLHKKAYCEAEEARRAGKPARAVEWRLGWVASRWERYTQRAVAS